MALARALGYGAQVDALSILYRLGCLDLITCINMKLFKVLKGDQLWLNHHGHSLFALPSRPRPPPLAFLTLCIMMMRMVGLGVSQMAVVMMGVMMILRRSLEARVVGGRLL